MTSLVFVIPADYIAGMARKRPAKPTTEPPAARGRPPLPPRTTLARWIRTHGLTVQSFAEAMVAAAAKVRMPDGKVGLPKSAAPQAKTLLDAVNARHWPSPPTMLLVRHLTKGEVDLEHWVRDLYEV